MHYALRNTWETVKWLTSESVLVSVEAVCWLLRVASVKICSGGTTLAGGCRGGAWMCLVCVLVCLLENRIVFTPRLGNVQWSRDRDYRLSVLPFLPSCPLSSFLLTSFIYTYYYFHLHYLFIRTYLSVRVLCILHLFMRILNSHSVYILRFVTCLVENVSVLMSRFGNVEWHSERDSDVAVLP